MTQPLRRTYRHPELVIRDRTFTWGERTYLMGVINLTPDSFSGDGLDGDVDAAVAQARRMDAEGADIIDLGAESTRPDAEPVDASEELRRLLPSLRAVRSATSLPLSVDTYRTEVAAAAIEAGADIVNDISGLRSDPAMASAIAKAGVPVVVMHNQRGRPFHDVIGDIATGFDETLAIATDAHIAPERIILDPGFGFGWKPEQNLEMLRRLPEIGSYELPILAGVSRKSTIGFILARPPAERAWGTAAATTLAIAGGADIVRVHDVAEMRDCARVADAIIRAHWRHHA